MFFKPILYLRELAWDRIEVFVNAMVCEIPITLSTLKRLNNTIMTI